MVQAESMRLTGVGAARSCTFCITHWLPRFFALLCHFAPLRQQFSSQPNLKSPSTKAQKSQGEEDTHNRPNQHL